MTDKEKVLKVHPDARVLARIRAHKKFYGVVSKGLWLQPATHETEEAAWQNAAESLLPQQIESIFDKWEEVFKDPRMDDSYSLCEPVAPVEAKEEKPKQHCKLQGKGPHWLCRCDTHPYPHCRFCSKPVEVEAKEKEQCTFCDLEICKRKGYEQSPRDLAVWVHKDSGLECCEGKGFYAHAWPWLNPYPNPRWAKPAEPKPTPSTPETLCVNCNRPKKEHRGPIYLWCKENCADLFKPQPDSSSISSEPEQIVSDKVIEQYAFDYAGDKLINQLARELQQWRKWAAAKGSK